MMQQILLALFPSIALIAGGYGLQRRRILAAEFWNGAEKLNYLILFPVLLFNNLAYVKFEGSTLTQVLLALVMIIIMSSLTLWIARAFFHIPVARFGVYVQSQIRFNTYIGLSIMSLLFGAQGMQMFAMMIALAIPLVNVISVLAFSQEQGLKPRQILFSVIKNPFFLFRCSQTNPNKIWFCLINPINSSFIFFLC